MRAVREEVEPHPHEPALPHPRLEDDRVLDVVLRLGPAAGADAAQRNDAVVHPLQQRPEAMGRVGDAVLSHLPEVPPGRVAGRIELVALHLVHVFGFAEVEVAEEAGLGHRRDGQVLARVAVVLGDHVLRR